MKTKFYITFISILIAMTLAACGGATVTPAPAIATQPPSALIEATVISTPTPELTLTVEELAGVWKDIDGYFEFKPDGTFAYATTLDALKAGTLEAHGTFRVEGDEFSFVSDNICGDRIGVYLLQTKTENKLTLTAVKEECGQRRLPSLERIPSGELLSSPVEFVWSITGDPNPLDVPTDLAIDLQGNLYVVDAGNDRIQVFDPDGNFVRMWGKTGSGEGEFNFLRANGDEIGGIAVDSDGNVYVADNANQRIQKFDLTGTFLLQWGSNGRGDGQFLSPIGITVDKQGNVYVIDDSRDDVQKFDSNGTFLLKWGSHGSRDGQFNYTGNLEIDSQGNVYVADFSNHRVQKFDSQGIFLTKWGTFGEDPGQFNDPVGIAIDPQGNVYVAELAAHPPYTHRVQIFDEAGSFSGTWGSPGDGNGEFTHPLAIAVDSQGNIYVSDETNRIQKFRLKEN